MTKEHPPTARRHREMLACSGLVVVLAFVLDVRSDQRVALAGFPDYPLPETCLSRQWFGVACPGCGLTRSFVYLARGDWRASLQAHRLGWLLALAVVMQLPYRLLALARIDRPLLPVHVSRGVAGLLIALLIGNWVVGFTR